MHTVLTYPVPRPTDINPYQNILKEELAALGVETVGFRQFHPLQTADTLHLHWPERLYQGGPARRSSVLSEIAFRNIWLTARRIKRAGGNFVWTAHNLRPHEPPSPRHQAVFARWHTRVLAEVDRVICMSEASVELIDAQIPVLSTTEKVVIEHPHYRDVYQPFADKADRAATRQRLNIPNDAWLVSMLGFVRPYKQAGTVIEAFRAAAIPNGYLLIAGNCLDPELGATLTQLAAELPQVRLLLQTVDDADLVAFSQASDLALFNFSDVLNSGSVLTALSLDVPCLAPNFGALPELARKVPGWVTLFTPPLTPDILRAAANRPRPSGRPDLRLFEPARFARLHLAAYQAPRG